MKNLNLKLIIKKLEPLLRIFRRYSALVFIVVLVGIYSFLVFRINSLTNMEPDDEAITQKLNTVKRPKIDQSSIDKINQLQGQNVEVKTLFDQARNNPFNE